MKTEQPTNTTWMQPPPVVAGCPEGLEYLTQLDQILIKQSYEIFEMMTGFETANKYKLKNNMGQTCYIAAEKSGCCTRMCCGPQRPFDMVIKDNDKREVIHLKRPLRCVSPCFFCCLQEVEVTSPVSGETLGFIKQKCHPCLQWVQKSWSDYLDLVILEVFGVKFSAKQRFPKIVFYLAILKNRF